MNAERAHTSLAEVVDLDGVLHGPGDIDRGDVGSTVLRCAGCGALMEAVHSYVRRAHAAAVHIGAHYRLAPGAEHERFCRYRPTDQHPGLGAHGPTLARTAAYQLVVPEPRGRQGARRSAGSWRRTQKPWGEPGLARPINSAAAVALLLSSLDGERLHHDLRIQHRGHRLDWPDFCYDANRYAILAEVLSGGGPSHPVAVAGRADRRGTATSGRSSYLLHAPRRSVMLEDRKTWLRVVLRTRQSWLLDRIHDGNRFLGLGWWRLHTLPSARGQSSRVDLTLWLRQLWQLTSWGSS